MCAEKQQIIYNCKMAKMVKCARGLCKFILLFSMTFVRIHFCDLRAAASNLINLLKYEQNIISILVVGAYRF